MDLPPLRPRLHRGAGHALRRRTIRLQNLQQRRVGSHLMLAHLIAPPGLGRWVEPLAVKMVTDATTTAQSIGINRVLECNWQAIDTQLPLPGSRLEMLALPLSEDGLEMCMGLPLPDHGLEMFPQGMSRVLELHCLLEVPCSVRGCYEKRHMLPQLDTTAHRKNGEECASKTQGQQRQCGQMENASDEKSQGAAIDALNGMLSSNKGTQNFRPEQKADQVRATDASAAAEVVTPPIASCLAPTDPNVGSAWESHVAKLLDEFSDAALRLGSNLSGHIRRLTSDLGEWPRRPRSLFPLPPPEDKLWDSHIPRTSAKYSMSARCSVRRFTLVCIAALNNLHGEALIGVLGRPTRVQSTALGNIICKVLHMFDGIVALQGACKRQPGRIWQSFGDPAVQPLKASAVDTPVKAAQCDPTARLPQEWRALISDSTKMFPHAHEGLKRFPGISGPQRKEYIEIVVAQIRAGKLALASDIKGGGTVFGRLKNDGVRMREIWHGSVVSKYAVRPPKPPDLASPSCFSFQELGPGERLYVSKRDAECYFDQLRLPECLEPFMGRPSVSKAELALHGLSTDEITRSMRSGTDPNCDKLYPVARVWGMGFSWSSAVGQQTLLSVCEDAGLTSDCLLSPQRDVPYGLDLQYAVATDDVMMFSKHPHESGKAAERLDRALEEADLRRKHEKDVNNASSCTCIGIDLSEGCRWEAPATRSYAAMADLVALAATPIAAPCSMAEYLGSLQWYDLLCRHKLSCYDTVYAFSRTCPANVKVSVPASVLDELFTSVALTPWWSVPLHREFAPVLVATDASTDFGFGGAVASADISVVRAISRLCCKMGDSVVLSDSQLPPTPGRKYVLGSMKEDFKTIFSIKAKRKDHINLLEAAALNLGIEWVLRHSARHNRRVIFFLDSKVVIGGASKGRSNSKPLLRELRRTAALILAGSLQPYYIYIGTHDNPSDFASRGSLRRSKQPRSLRRVRHHMAEKTRCFRRLRDCGHLLDFPDSPYSDSSSSNYDW